MEKGTKYNPHTILSSMEDIVVKAKEHGLDDIFYSESENSMKRLSRALLMSKEELFPGMDLIQKDEQQDRRLIPYTSFVKKSLFYETQVQMQIDRLAELLDKDRFTQVTQRLSESGMRKGFACLFYGSPGTGKTDTVNQLARITGRDVMLVDVT